MLAGRSAATRRAALARAGALAAAAFALAPLAAARRPALPPIVFVSRERVPGSTLVPGIGPAGRTVATGGALLVRESDGRVHPLVAPGRFFDVAHPAVSYDGRTVAFAAVVARDSAWRLWRVDASGRDLAPLTRSDRALDPAALYGRAGDRFARYDDFDPCWLPDGRVVFASTRWPLAAEGGGVASELWIVGADGAGMRRLTTERNGAETPSVDPRSGRIVYARWWFSRFRAAADTTGVTTDPARAAPADSVDLWHAVSVDASGDHLRLAGGDPRSRAGQMAYQPLVLADGTLVGVCAEHPSLARATRLGLQRTRGGFGDAEPLFGAGAPTGWSACGATALPDGRLLFSMDEDGTGNFDLYACDADGRRLERLGGAPDLLELDAAALAPRPRPSAPAGEVLRPGEATLAPPSAPPPLDAGAVARSPQTARFDCLNVFANAPVDSPWPDAVPIQRDVRIRFFTVVSRPGAEGGDSLVSLGTAAVTAQGAVHVDQVPADVPMFEQLIDAHGRVLRSGSGPAHVPGFNSVRPGAGTQCVGCHAGHSALPVPATAQQGEWTNVAPSARVTATSERRECAGARAAVDRRTLGDPTQVAWIADTSAGQSLRLEWDTPIEAKALVLHAFRAPPRDGGLVRVRRSEVVLFLQGKPVGRLSVSRELDPAGTRVEFPITRLDAIEVRLLDVTGRFRGRPAAALAEVETLARIAWQ